MENHSINNYDISQQGSELRELLFKFHWKYSEKW